MARADCDVEEVVLQPETTSGVVMQLKGTPESTCNTTPLIVLLSSLATSKILSSILYFYLLFRKGFKLAK